MADVATAQAPADVRPGAAGAGLLDQLAGRLCAIQNTAAPSATPRRLIVFAAADAAGGIHASANGEPVRDALTMLVEAIAAGTAVSSALAKSTHSELVLVDLGAPVDPLAETAGYRCRRIRDHTLPLHPPYTSEEYREAFTTGQQEAERAHGDGIRVIGAGEIRSAAPDLSALVARLDQTDRDHLQMLAELSLSLSVAAIAGLFAHAAELGLTIVLDGPATVAAAIIAANLVPAVPSMIVAAPAGASAAEASALARLGDLPRLEGWTLQLEEGAGALLAFPLLDAAAAAAARRRREAGGKAAEPKTRKVALFTGSFDPPTTFHCRVAKIVRNLGFDEVIVRPSGPRPEQPDGEHAAPVHRAAMVDLAFGHMPGVSVDLHELDEGAVGDDYRFDQFYGNRGEVWHIVSSDFIAGGRQGECSIQTRWVRGAELWNTGRFLVLHDAGAPPDPADLPPRCLLAPVEGHVTTADIRLRVYQGGDPGEDVPPAVADYIRRYQLFSDAPPRRESRIKLDQPRLLIVPDESNPRARAMIHQFRHLESPEPNVILVLGGDGTMLKAIRKHWRKRLPFVGLNTGHLGFLMNEMLPANLAGTELVVYRMPMLRVDLTAPDGRTRRELAYVDVWLERNTGQAAWLKVEVDGHMQVPKVVGDGLLVATPSGSSAYARAMGATPLPLTAPVLTLAGSNVFRPRFWKPVALPETAVVRITNLDETGKRPIRGFLDGESLGPVAAMDVRISSIAAVELAFTPQFDLSARLLRSLFPPEEG